MKMSIEIVPYVLHRPFVISGHVFNSTETVRVTLSDGDYRGHGETVGTYYLNETAASMADDLEAVAGQIDARLSTDRIQELLPPCGARNALDCAYWDLRAKRENKRIWQLLDIEPRELITVFTISIDSPQRMAEMAAEAVQFPHLKIKLGSEDPMERLAAVRAARPDAELVVDANQAWSFNELQSYLPHCEALRVNMIEQPLARGGDEALEGFSSPVALGADESCLHLGEFEAAARRYDVLNIKLDKCGGLTEGLALVNAAREAGMQLMVGNMTGTSLSMAPSYVIGQFCRFVDIDGPLLLGCDIENGLHYGAGGSVGLPSRALWG
ncbi:MAG: dipeptide epimerase [Halieaceae bacterium]|jgi:L-alanine-DL-glutamate epimerase-like enolase superfamily enzyme|nr:dipeptide epimerase [Halieaceae bacterium]